MKNFKYNRFLQTLKWNITTEKKTLFTHTLAFVAAFLLVQLFYIGLLNVFQEPGRQSVLAAMIMCVSAGGLLAAYYASGILGNARTKEQRTTMLMLPASVAEKFWARMAYVIVVIPVLIAAAFIVATLLRMGVQWLLGHNYIVFGLDIFSDYGGFDFLWLLVSHLYAMSLFVLGGVLFSKHPFIWTGISIMGGLLLLGTIATLLLKLQAPSIHHLRLSVNIPEAVGYLIFTALTVFNVWLSYRLFCRLQLVQHKWFNL